MFVLVFSVKSLNKMPEYFRVAYGFVLTEKQVRAFAQEASELNVEDLLAGNPYFVFQGREFGTAPDITFGNYLFQLPFDRSVPMIIMHDESYVDLPFEELTKIHNNPKNEDIHWLYDLLVEEGIQPRPSPKPGIIAMHVYDA